MRRGARPVLLAAGLIACLTVSVPVSEAQPARAQLEQAEARMMELIRDFEIVLERYNAVEDRARRIQLRLAQADLELEEMSDRVAQEESLAVALANDLYRNGTAAATEAVLSARSVAEIDHRTTLIAYSEKARAEVFRDLAESQRIHEARVALLDRDRAGIGTALTQANAARDEVEALLAAQEREIQELTNLLLREQAAARLAAQAAVDATSPLAGIPDHLIEPEPAPNPTAQAALDAALAQLGKPYVWGGSGPEVFDCSGLTSWAYARAGVHIPRNSAMQYAALQKVDGDWEPGDLLFFGTPIHHVGMYIGSEQMVHAPFTGAAVRVNLAGRPDLVGVARPAP